MFYLKNFLFLEFNSLNNFSYFDILKKYFFPFKKYSYLNVCVRDKIKQN